MVALTRAWRWQRFEPDFGDNLEQPEGNRLALEIASGVSASELQAVGEAVSKASRPADGDDVEGDALAKRWAAALAHVVRLVPPPSGQLHTVAGKTLATLEDYLRVILKMAGIYNLQEVTNAVRDYNSVEGTSRLFSQRQSGGFSTTRARPAVKDSETTAAR